MKILIMVLVLLPVICFGATVVRTLNAPGNNISGLAWGEGKLWCLDEGNQNWCYGLDPVSGNVEVSFKFTGYSNYTAAGLTYNGQYLFGSFVKSNNSTYVYWYTTAGSYIYYDILC